MKTIHLTVTADIKVPNNAEIICITDDDGTSDEYIRVAGKLVRPAIHWMEYFSKQNPDPRCPVAPGLDGISFGQINQDFEEEYLQANPFVDYTLTETKQS